MSFKYLKIPAEILLLDLSSNTKLILAEIMALSDKQPCTASNTTISSILGMTTRSVIRSLKILEEKGLITIRYPNATTREIVASDKMTGVTKCHGCQNVTSATDKMSLDYCQNVTSATDKMSPTTDKMSPYIIINNKEINNNKIIAESIEAGAQVEDEFSEIVRMYQDNIQIITSPIIQDQLSDLFDTYGYEWVQKAIEEATLSNGRSLKYINAILMRWQAVGTNKPWEVQRHQKGQGQERMDELRQMYEEIMNE